MNRLFALLRRLGPGLISVCVVIGPGSLLTSLRVGATHGYSLLWVLAIAVGFMMLFLSLGARLGVLAEGTPGEMARRHLGPIWVLAIGVGVFVIATIFQSGNNLGVLGAVEAWQARPAPTTSDSAAALTSEADPSRAQSSQTQSSPAEAANATERVPETWRRWLPVASLVFVNAIAILFLLFGAHFYRNLERLMTVFVALMLIAFATNLWFVPPDPFALLKGFVPFNNATDSFDFVVVIGWISTTCIPAVAWFQGYLAKQKGWTRSDLQTGIWDARLGAILLGGITLMITITAAEALAGASLGKASLVEIARLLDPAFGSWGKRIFAAGLFSAAYSSFLVNASIGGFLLADGLGLDTRPERLAPRLFAIAVLLLGMLPALLASLWESDVVNLVVVAQALTVFVSPLIVFVLLWLTSRSQVMAGEPNGWLTNLLGICGAVLMVLAALTLLVTRVIPTVQSWFLPTANAYAQTAQATDEPLPRIATFIPSDSPQISPTASRFAQGPALVVDRQGGWWQVDPDRGTQPNNTNAESPSSPTDVAPTISTSALMDSDQQLLGATLLKPVRLEVPPELIELQTSSLLRSADQSLMLIAGVQGQLALMHDDGHWQLADQPCEVAIDQWLGWLTESQALGASRWGRCLIGITLISTSQATPSPSETNTDLSNQSVAKNGADQPLGTTLNSARRSFDGGDGNPRYLDLPFSPGASTRIGNQLWVADAFGSQIALVDLERWSIVGHWSHEAGVVHALAFEPQHNRLWGISTTIDPNQSTDEHRLLSGAVAKRWVWSLAVPDLASGTAAWHEPTRSQLTNPGADPIALFVPADRIVIVYGGAGGVVSIERETLQPVAHWRTSQTLTDAWLRGDDLLVADRFSGLLVQLDSDLNALRTMKIEQSEPSYRERGEALFHSAAASLGSHLSCATCHRAGHTNAALADTLGDGTYGTPKLVPSLLGVADTDPWGWLGNRKELSDQVERSFRETQHYPLRGLQVRDVVGYLFTLEPPALSRAAQQSVSQQPESWERGKALFGQHCGACHVAPLTFTTNGNFDVTMRDEAGAERFNPPSLRAVSQRGRYLHDGSAHSLEAVLVEAGHPPHVALSESQVADLKTYLLSL